MPTVICGHSHDLFNSGHAENAQVPYPGSVVQMHFHIHLEKK
jgi:hypothetical protein